MCEDIFLTRHMLKKGDVMKHKEYGFCEFVRFSGKYDIVFKLAGDFHCEFYGAFEEIK